MGFEVDVKLSGDKIAPQSDLRVGAASIFRRYRKRRAGGLRAGEWNVRTLLDRDKTARPERRTAIVDRELARYRVDEAALSETRFHGIGHLREKNYSFFWSGKEEKQPRQNGVAIVVKNELLAGIKDFPVCISDRIMKLRIPISVN